MPGDWGGALGGASLPAPSVYHPYNAGTSPKVPGDHDSARRSGPPPRARPRRAVAGFASPRRGRLTLRADLPILSTRGSTVAPGGGARQAGAARTDPVSFGGWG